MLPPNSCDIYIIKLQQKMTLLQQFPDVSMQMRRLTQKNTQKKTGSQKDHNANGNCKELDLYYDNEFRKWHIKLALIIVFIITCLLVALVGISRLF
jgi:hypothetical protein